MNKMCQKDIKTCECGIFAFGFGIFFTIIAFMAFVFVYALIYHPEKFEQIKLENKENDDEIYTLPGGPVRVIPF